MKRLIDKGTGWFKSADCDEATRVGSPDYPDDGALMNPAPDGMGNASRRRFAPVDNPAANYGF